MTKQIKKIKLLRTHDGIPNRVQITMQDGSREYEALVANCEPQDAELIANKMGMKLEVL